jgi:hypothetical protein
LTEIKYFIRRVGREIVLAFALVYFLLDVIFLSLVRPMRQHVMAWRWVRRLRNWVMTHNPYMALCLLLVPWLILEPLKPLGFLLFHRHHHLAPRRSSSRENWENWRHSISYSTWPNQSC